MRRKEKPGDCNQPLPNSKKALQFCCGVWNLAIEDHGGDHKGFVSRFLIGVQTITLKHAFSHFAPFAAYLADVCGQTVFI